MNTKPTQHPPNFGSRLIAVGALGIAIFYLGLQFFVPSLTQDMPGFVLLLVSSGFVATLISWRR